MNFVGAAVALCGRQGKGRKNRNIIVVGTGANVRRAVKQIHRAIEKNTF